MRQGDLRVGDWLVQPDLDRIQRDGHIEHLRPKTMQVLAALAERAGEVVSRTDFQRVVWHDVHVSEESLSHCIAGIRSVLGDDAKEPKYVETVAKHGYRLIAPVTPVPTADPEAVPGSAADGGPFRRFARPLPRAAALLGLCALLAVAVTLGIRWRRSPPDTRTHVLLLADWRNRTGDAVFDDTLRQALAVELERAPNISVVSRASAST